MQALDVEFIPPRNRRVAFNRKAVRWTVSGAAAAGVVYAVFVSQPGQSAAGDQLVGAVPAEPATVAAARLPAGAEADDPWRGLSPIDRQAYAEATFPLPEVLDRLEDTQVEGVQLESLTVDTARAEVVVVLSMAAIDSGLEFVKRLNDGDAAMLWRLKEAEQGGDPQRRVLPWRAEVVGERREARVQAPFAQEKGPKP